MDTSIQFQSIIPANSVLTLAKGVASFFALILQNDGELWLTKYTEDRSVIWHRLIGNYTKFSIPFSTYTLMEDEQAFIHVVTGYNGTFEPYFKSEENPEIAYNTLIIKLSSNGEVVDVARHADMLNYQLVKIVNDVWLVTYRRGDCNGFIQIRNLTTGGSITNIIGHGSITVSDAFYHNTNLFITLGAIGSVTYRGKTITIDKLSALLVIIHVPTWELVDYFIAEPAVATTPGCSSEGDRECTNSVSFLAIVTNDQGYYVAGLVRGQNMLIYHRTELLGELEFKTVNTLIICRISRSNPDEPISPDNVDIRCTHFPVTQGDIQYLQLVHMIKDDGIVLVGRANNVSLLDSLNIPKTLHIARHIFMIRFSSNLELSNFKTISSGTGLAITNRGDCDCSNCTGSPDNSRYIPCRITRLFPPGATTSAGNNITCGGHPYGGFTYVDSSKSWNSSVIPGVFYNAYRGNGHCIDALVNGQPGNGQPGDLYNTKYKGISLSGPDSITQASNGVSPQSVSPMAVEGTDNILIPGTFIDNLIIDNTVQKMLYRQKWFGYVLNFTYN